MTRESLNLTEHLQDRRTRNGRTLTPSFLLLTGLTARERTTYQERMSSETETPPPPVVLTPVSQPPPAPLSAKDDAPQPPLSPALHDLTITPRSEDPVSEPEAGGEPGTLVVEEEESTGAGDESKRTRLGAFAGRVGQRVSGVLGNVGSRVRNTGCLELLPQRRIAE